METSTVNATIGKGRSKSVKTVIPSFIAKLCDIQPQSKLYWTTGAQNGQQYIKIIVKNP